MRSCQSHAPVGTFQRITSTAPLRAETREAIQNTVLQFYVQNSQPEDDAEGLTASNIHQKEVR